VVHSFAESLTGEARDAVFSQFNTLAVLFQAPAETFLDSGVAYHQVGTHSALLAAIVVLLLACLLAPPIVRLLFRPVILARAVTHLNSDIAYHEVSFLAFLYPLSLLSCSCPPVKACHPSPGVGTCFSGRLPDASQLSPGMACLQMRDASEQDLLDLGGASV
jgi:hypothetical protein